MAIPIRFVIFKPLIVPPFLSLRSSQRLWFVVVAFSATFESDQDGTKVISC